MRYHSLDAVRGYAALTVLIAHTTAVGIYKNPSIWPYLEWSPFRFLWAGHQAVIVFFVLSGFALTKMIQSAVSFSIVRYLLARIARLYIPFMLSLAFVFIVHMLLKFSGYDWSAGWMGIPKPDFNHQQILEHAGMIGVYNYFAINPPSWSLVYEARISILFPLIYILVKRFSFKTLIVLLALDLICLFWISTKPGLYGVDYFSSSILTLHYCLFFAMGSYVALNIEVISKPFIKMNNKAAFLFLFIAMMAYSYPFNNPWSLTERGLGDIITSLGAIVIMMLSLRIFNGVVYSVGVYLGKISFSLYLVHYTVLSASIIIFYNISFLLVWAVTISLSVATAHVFTYVVDLPSIKISRMFYRKGANITAVEKAS